MKEKILLTGNAGFIGFHVGNRLAKEGYEVIGIDNLNNYYDVDYKVYRLKMSGFETDENNLFKVTSTLYPNFSFRKMDLIDKVEIAKLFDSEKFDFVIHLAAQAGVRYSIEHPDKYIQSNIIGFHNLLEESKKNHIKHFIYASSSSVYGLNSEMPFNVAQKTDTPINLYAASKKTNELMAHAYSNLFKLPTTGLRFFTVYGPWGRPDMAPFLFADAIMKKKEIMIFNFGEMERDFTYVDDVVESLMRLIYKKAEDIIPYQIHNIGNGKPVNLLYFIQSLEKEFGYTVKKNLMPLQAGDVIKTWADISSLEKIINFRPIISIEEGTKKFIDWFKVYNEKNNT